MTPKYYWLFGCLRYKDGRVLEFGREKKIERLVEGWNLKYREHER